MRKNRMKKILVMCVIINILFCAEVESVLAYPAQCSISVTRREQQETNWCWAAVSQMIGAHALVLSGYSADGKVTLVDPAANAGIERYSYSSLVAGTTIQSGSGRYTKTWTLD